MIYYNLLNWIIYYYIQNYFFLLFYYSIFHLFNILTFSRFNFNFIFSFSRNIKILSKNFNFSLYKEKWFLYIIISKIISEFNWFYIIIIIWFDKLKIYFISISIIEIINIFKIIWFNLKYKYLFIYY